VDADYLMPLLSPTHLIHILTGSLYRLSGVAKAPVIVEIHQLDLLAMLAMNIMYETR
jgi:hypothetical protein